MSNWREIGLSICYAIQLLPIVLRLIGTSRLSEEKDRLQYAAVYSITLCLGTISFIWFTASLL